MQVTDNTAENRKIIVNELRSKWGKVSVKELTALARQARENAAGLRDKTTAALFGKLASAIDAQIWFLRSPSRASGTMSCEHLWFDVNTPPGLPRRPRLSS